LIKHLKEAYLPLKEIKRRLEDLPIAEMQELEALFQQDPAGALAGLGVYPTELGSSAAAPMLLQAEEQNGDGESAREYIQRALHRAPATLRESPQPYLPAAASTPAPTAAEGNAETWQRVELAPGVELHIRQPQGGENAKDQQVDELIHLARRIFTK
jgi:DNA-binding transcriptional MerR regulator